MRLCTRSSLAGGVPGLVALLALAACDDSGTTADAASSQWYHVRLAVGTGETIPFFLQVPDDCEAAAATVVNGLERLHAACHRSTIGFVVEFPVYATLLEAWFEPDGSLVGHWCRERSAGREPVLQLEGEPVGGPDPATRFGLELADEDAPATDLSGVWRIELDEHGVARGVFRQESAVVRASVESPTTYGDLRFLAGNVAGRRLLLSTFDGQRAYALAGEVMPDGTIVGEWIRHDSREGFVAERDEDLAMPDPLRRVAFAPDRRRLELESLRDTKYDGKPVIVQIFGTWCPNCNDHAPVLVELYRRYRAEGLEIVGLAYEYGPGAEYNKRRVRAFREKHGADWEIVITGMTPEDLALEGLAGLFPLGGVPVTIFLNRDHTVHAIYSGFSGPATGESHREAKARFEQMTAEILAGAG